MKTFLPWISRAALTLGLMAGIAASLNAETRQINAQVQSVNGSATFQVPGEPPTPITVGVTIPAGAVIQTAPGVSLNIFMGYGTGVVRLDGNSILKINVLQVTETGSERVADTQLELVKGEMFGSVNKISKGSTYNVTLPDGVVDLRQSRFQIVHRGVDGVADNAGAPGSDRSLASTVRVLSGKAVFNHQGESHRFDGPGEFNPGSDGVAPLGSDAAQFIAQVTGDLKTGSPAKGPSEGGDNNQIFKKIASDTSRTLAVQQQEIALSPTTGSN